MHPNYVVIVVLNISYLTLALFGKILSLAIAFFNLSRLPNVANPIFFSALLTFESLISGESLDIKPTSWMLSLARGSLCRMEISWLGRRPQLLWRPSWEAKRSRNAGGKKVERLWFYWKRLSFETYDDALPNWHTIHRERVKNQDQSEIEPWVSLFCGWENLPLSHTGLLWSLG